VYPASAAARSRPVDPPPSPAEASRLGARVTRLLALVENVRRREDRLALLLSLLIGALVGLMVVAFILLTGRLAAHMYPAGDAAAWRRILVPTLGALVSGVLLYRFFPDARGSGIPQTRAAIYVHDGRISFRTVFGKFVCCATSLASGIA
jgi:CIC family chloride channel protein